MKHWEEENDRNASLMSSFAQSGKDCNFSLKSNIVIEYPDACFIYLSKWRYVT